MIGSISAQVALFAFAAAIGAGIVAGNSPTTILIRALVAMLAASVVGKLVAWSTKLVLRDHLQHKKLAIDEQHVEARERAETLRESEDQPEAITEAG